MNSTTTSNVSYNCYMKRYKAAIALNNAAITLLERDCYSDASDMFRAAVYLIQLSFCALGKFDPNVLLPTIPSLSDDDISHHLMNAARCHQSNDNKRSASTISHQNSSIITFSTQHNACLIGEYILRESHGGTRTIFTYITIEPIDFEEMNLDSVYHDSMLILYNFGVAHCALAQSIESSIMVSDHQNTDEWMPACELQQNAYQMFHVIEDYVTRKLNHAVAVQQSQENGLMMLCALLSRTMSELALQLESTIISHYYNLAFCALLILIDEHSRSVPVATLQAAAAA